MEQREYFTVFKNSCLQPICFGGNINLMKPNKNTSQTYWNDVLRKEGMPEELRPQVFAEEDFIATPELDLSYIKNKKHKVICEKYLLGSPIRILLKEHPKLTRNNIRWILQKYKIEGVGRR